MPKVNDVNAVGISTPIKRLYDVSSGGTTTQIKFGYDISEAGTASLIYQNVLWLYDMGSEFIENSGGFQAVKGRSNSDGYSTGNTSSSTTYKRAYYGTAGTGMSSTASGWSTVKKIDLTGYETLNVSITTSTSGTRRLGILREAGAKPPESFVLTSYMTASANKVNTLDISAYNEEIFIIIHGYSSSYDVRLNKIWLA
jgi:hypothetical protein